jgi:hypothetical protein
VKIVVNHLTRMAPGFMCVAGVETSTNAHIRPVIPHTRFRTQLLLRNGGLFDIATEVDLGSVTNVGSAPELEDRSFDLSKARVVRERISANELWTLLEHSGNGSLREIFGADLENAGRSAALLENTGQGSLGNLIPSSQPQLGLVTYGSKDKIEIMLEDRDLGQLTVAVTDIRFYRPPAFAIRQEVFNQYYRELDANVPVILSVGVSRKFKKPADVAYRHWLQVNNIHLQSVPTRQDREL